MDELLRQLLNRLEAIGATNEEIYDTECRDRMGDAVFDGFIRPVMNFSLPLDFGLLGSAANDAVRTALAEYMDQANRLAPTVGASTFHGRLKAYVPRGEIKTWFATLTLTGTFDESHPAKAIIIANELRTLLTVMKHLTSIDWCN